MKPAFKLKECLPTTFVCDRLTVIPKEVSKREVSN